jgi:hypothetical protein
MKPVTIQVITYAPTVFYHCQHCEITFSEMGLGERLRRQEAAESLPPDLLNEFQVLSDWVHELIERHGSRIRVKVIDAASIEGFAASIRHRVARYPVVILPDGERRIGTDFAALDPIIDRQVTAAARVPATT